MEKIGALERVKAQLVIVTGLLVIYFMTKSVYWLYGSAVVGVVSLALPAVGSWIVRAWFKLAEVLGKINSTVILTLLFGVFLVPIALLYRLTSKNPLSLKNDGTASLYHDRNHTYTKDDLETMW